MNEQPEALRLINNRQNAHLISWQANACAELRRLHKVNQELLEALKGSSNYIDKLGGVSGKYRQRITKATGEQA